MKILDLCSGSGAWSQPYKDAGYEVEHYDLTMGLDVRLLEDPGLAYGVLAAPPCKHFSCAGAQHWQSKGEPALLEGLSIVDACIRIILVTKPKFWALENPVGRLRRYLGKPRLIFQPFEYGDFYTKRTLLWGEFNLPEKTPVYPHFQSLIHTTIRDPRKRSITPPGFAQAFYEANR